MASDKYKMCSKNIIVLIILSTISGTKNAVSSSTIE